jgi:integrase
MRKPFYNKRLKAWYVWHNGKQERIGDTEEEAYEGWQLLKVEPITAAVPVVQLLDSFLDWTKERRAEQTYDWYLTQLTSFSKHIGGSLVVSSLKPHHVTNWVQKEHKGQSDNTIRGAIRAVQRAFNWAIREGYVKENPVRNVEKPAAKRRETFITPDQWSDMLSLATDDPERDFLGFMREAGCRVQEIRAIEKRHVSGTMIVFPPSEGKKKKVRVIYLTGPAKEIVDRLCEKWPTGPIFRNSKGRPWTRNAIRCRFRKFKKKLGIPDLCGTVIRHVFITEALQNGVNPVALAELVGHTDTSMISRHYAHLSRNQEFLLEQAKKATGGCASE